MTLGKRLKELRNRAGYTKEDIASRLGVSFSLVDKWELGIRRPSLEKSGKLAVLYGMTVDELIADTLLNPDQKLKAAEIGEAIANNDTVKQDKMRKVLHDKGYSEEKTEWFFNAVKLLVQ